MSLISPNFRQNTDGNNKNCVIYLTEIIKNNKISALEYKYDVKKVKIPSEFKQAYPDSKFYLINQDNYLDFIT